MTATRTGNVVPPEGLRLVFIGVLAVWLLFPFVLRDNLAQDAVPLVVAGELVRSNPDAIYAAEAKDLYDLPPAFAQRSCEISPPGTDCSNLNVAFVSAPQALPFVRIWALLGPTGGVLLARLLASLSLAGGMLVLWRRLAHRTRRAPACLVASVILLTPFVMVPLPLGQTSPYLFLSACAGVTVADKRRLWAVLVAGLWALTVSLKLFPAALVLVLLWQRRWVLIAWAAAWMAALTALAVALAPVSMFGRFVTTSRVLAGYSLQNPYNGSFDATVHSLVPALTDNPAPSLVLLAVRAAGVGAVAWFALRRADDDTQWAWAWLAVLLFVPLVWWHYLWLAIAAIGVALAGRARLDDRMVLALPVAAAITIPISIPNGQGSAWPLAQFAFLVAALGVAAWVAHDGAGSREPVPI